MAGNPVEWLDRYTLSDVRPGANESAQATGQPVETRLDFARYEDRVADLTPHAIDLPPGTHPFPTRFARRNSSLTFNVAGYSRQLVDDFLVEGGRINNVEFHSPSELSRVSEKVIINATGYGARALWKDESIVPVRGQIAWLIPQQEVNYGVKYGNVNVLARRDGIVVQDVGTSDREGYNDDDEQPNRPAAESAVRQVSELFGRMNWGSNGRRG
jgi:glycine/D-amino acid oxidase-like deaminating enzyme